MRKFESIIIFTFICLFAYLVEASPSTVVLIEIGFCLSCIYLDIKSGYRNISFITFYSTFSLLYLVGNYLTINSLGTVNESIYNYYLIKENLSTSTFITLIGNIAIVSGYELVSKTANKKYTLETIKLNFHLNYSWAYILVWITIFNQILQLSGKFHIQAILNLSSPIIFLSVRFASANRDRKLLLLCLFLSLITAYWSLLFSYRRQSIFEPFLYFLLGYLLGYKSFRAFKEPLLIPVYICLIITISLFTILGNIRGTARGQDRIDLLTSKIEAQSNERISEDENEGKGNFWARSSNINQLTQIVRLVDEDGFYEGGTMQYLAFAFIPRFLWADKPPIMQGRWFALRTGLAYQYGNDLTTVNNSVNMTVPGELFLNFGFIGIIVGMSLIGILMNHLWGLSQFWDSDSNVLGNIWGAYLILVALFYINVDMQFIVSMLSTLFSLICVNFIVGFLFPKFKQSSL